MKDSLRCLRCNGARDLGDCGASVICGGGEVCTKGTMFGKRDGSLSCSKCCFTDDCNTNLCGIQQDSNYTTKNQCYQCSGVTDMSQCTNLVTCQSDEMCMVETFRAAGQNTYTAGCGNARLCSLIVSEAFRRRKECDIPNPDPFICGLGRRQTKICTTCCGDSRCNGDTCENTTDRMYRLWKFGVFDTQTLRVITSG